MSRLVMVLTMGGLLAAAGGAPGTEEAAKQARLSELNARLDALYKEVLAPAAEGGWTAEEIDRRIAGYRQAGDLKMEIARLTLSAADAARFGDYVQKQTEAYIGLVEVWGDPTLDGPGKVRRFRELSQDLQTLRTDYADVVEKAPAFDRNALERRAQDSQTSRLRDQLKATDEEWMVLEPLIREVVSLVRELEGLRSRSAPVREGGRGLLGRAQMAQRTVAERELADLLKQDDVPASTIKAKLAAIRQERAERAKKAAAVEAKLEAARERLRELLTIRQEAVLVSEDILD